MRTSEGLSARQKRLLFRAWHRGTREMDIVLGSFADARIVHLTDNELDDLEQLMEVPDPDLFKWITGEAKVPDIFDSDIYNTLLVWHRNNRAISSVADK